MLTNIDFKRKKQQYVYLKMIINPHRNRPLNQTKHFAVKLNMQKNTPYDV